MSEADRNEDTDINALIERIEQLEIENQRVSEEVRNLREQLNHNTRYNDTTAAKPSATSKSHNKARSSTRFSFRKKKVTLSKQEREQRSILPLSGEVAEDSNGTRIKLGDKVYVVTPGQFDSRYGIVTQIGSEKSDRIFFKDEDGYIQNRAAKNLTVINEE